MTMRRAGVVLAVAIALGAAVAGRQAAQVFRASADVVLLSVTVTDNHERPVGGLTQTDFHVVEGGAPQTISFFSREPQPIALSILIDTSTSMEPKLKTAQEAAVGFVRRLGPNDVAQIITFDNQAVVQQAFTGDTALLEKAIRRTTANGSTALYIAMYVALNDLKRTYDRPSEGVRRQAIVLLSDGDDTTSLIDYDQVLEEAKRSNVVIYSIALRSKQDQSSHEYGTSGGDLRWLATVSGGRSFLVTEPSQLTAMYQKIADELASQYMIGYVSTNTKRDGAWRPVSVGVERPESVIRTRAGYFAPTVPR